MDYQKCMYHGKEVFVREVNGDQVTLMTRDGFWAEDQSDWERVDKFAWEKVVNLKDIDSFENAKEK